jgi:leucyl aminopeptidase
VLYPEDFASRCKALEAHGLDVTILGESEMKKLGMNALLGVGQGSRKESQLVVMRWTGSDNADDAPLAFVGKGVCFDSGGISIKPAPNMEEMTMDMGGAAAVTGVMLTLARRKAKVNVVGVIGLVENMPDGNAQRPGDVVTSMSGQTIEIINTDAEGRLVLADALWYTHTRFNPKLMIDLATLTGAIIMALASEYAGLFSNHKDLTQALIEAGETSGDALWAFPMGEAYNKAMKSRVADVANAANGSIKGAGSITAACFLERFIPKDMPWAHLDIAGTAYIKTPSALQSGGGTGFGVRLLNQLVKNRYENGVV